VKFLIDEMFGPAVADRLRAAGHDAVGVRDLGLASRDDATVLARAVRDDRVVVTVNAADFAPLLDQRAAAGEPLTPVVVVLKRNLPRGAGAMSNSLARRLGKWCDATPDPYRHLHWLT
jgi:predicted nuclease of predicted toxin-antitoxin system